MIRSALAWSFAGQLTATAINFAGSVVIARLLTPHDLGIYAVATATIGILQLFTSFGVAMYVVREEQLTPEVLAAAFTMNAALSAALGALLYAASFGVARFLHDDAVAAVLQLLAITPLLGAFAFGPAAMLQRELRFRGTAIIGTACSLVATGVTIGGALEGARYMSPAYGAIASGMVGTLATIAIGRQHVSWRLSTRDWRRMASFGLRLMSIGGISSAAVRVSDLILGNMLGLSALGLYSRATNITNLLFQNVYATMTRVVFARLSAAQRGDGDVTAVYLRGLRLVSGIMGPLLIGLAVLARPAIYLLYGERWLGVATPLSLLLVGQFVSLSFAMNWELFVVRDRLAIQTRLEVTRSVVGIVTQVIGSLFSLVAVAATSIVDNLISMVLYGRYMPDLAGTSGGRLRHIYGEAVLLTLAAALPSLTLMAATGWRAEVPFGTLAAAILLGGVAWAVTAYFIDHPLVEEAQRLLALSRRLHPGRAAGAGLG